MRRRIYFWHGRSEEIEEKVAACCDHHPEEDEYYWSGSLDLFAKHFENFMVLDDVIAVTHHKSFSVRG